MKIVLGTMNPSKTEELRHYFDGVPDLEPVSPMEIGLTKVQIDENAPSVRENALLKARTWVECSKLPVIAEDSGLLFPDLPPDHPDQPGQFVRRWKGKNLSDEEMLNHYIDIARRHGGEIRACWQNCWWILQDLTHGLLYENHSTVFFLRTNPSPKRHPGWPLDSISYLPRLGKYLVEVEDHGELTDMDEIGPGVVTWAQETAQLLLKQNLPVY